MSLSNGASGESTLTARLPSNLEAYHEYIQQVLEKLESLGWDHRDRFAVEMALEESISNAVRHGNKLNPAKQVDVECRVNKDRFWACIKDEGPGFNPESVPDCRSEECLDKPGGRGLALIGAYMTKAEYTGCGNCLILEKRLDETPAPRAD